MPGSDVEVLSFAVTLATETPAIEFQAEPAASPVPAPVGVRPVRDTVTGEIANWAVYDRASLPAGASLAGPAIVAEAETSTLVGPRWRCRVDGLGYLELGREEQDA